MSGWLLDTNIVSELRRPKPERRVLAFVTAQPASLLFASSVTFAELRYGIEMSSDPVQRVALTEWLANRVRPLFDQRILPVSEDVMLRWRHLVNEGRKARHTLTQPHLIIAATALYHDMTIVTRDVDDFRRAGVKLFNPWTEEVPSR